MDTQATRTEWPKDDRLWRVQTIGEAHQSPGVPSELSLDVLLAWVKDRKVEPPSRQWRIVKASVPQLPSLHIAQLWRNGLQVGLSPSVEFSDVLDFSPENCRIIEAGEPLPTDKSHFLIPPDVHRFAPVLRSRCLSIGFQGKPDVVIIPCPEIARAWYFRSTDLALRLTAGPLSTVLLNLYNDKFPQTVMNGQWLTVVRTGLDHLDAQVVSMIRCDRFARKQIRRMTDSIVRAALEKVPRYMEALPPLTGEWPVVAQGRWFGSGGVKRFLVYYLTEVQYPPNPGTLHWDLDNRNNSIDTGEPKKEKKGWPKRDVRTKANSKHGLGNTAEPDSGSSSVHEFTVMPEFIGAPVMERLPPPVQTTTNIAGTAPPAPPEGPVSTGAGVNRPGAPTRLRIHPDRTSGPVQRQILPADFKGLLALVKYLNEHSLLRCRVVRGSKDIAGSADEPRSFFRTGLESYSKKSQRWVMIDDRARQFMAVEMSLSGKYLYAIETERRKDPKTGNEKDKHTLAVVRNDEAGKLGLTEFAILSVLGVQRCGVWPKEYNNIRIEKVKHQFSSTERFAFGIEKAAMQLVPAFKEPILAVWAERSKAGRKRKKRKTS